MTTPSSDSLLRVPDRSEADRVKIALRLAKDALDIPQDDPEVLYARGAALRRIISILEKE